MQNGACKHTRTGIIGLNKIPYEFQSYLCFEGTKEKERLDKIKAHIQTVNIRYGSIHARPVPEVPEILNSSYVIENYPVKNIKPYFMPLGIDYETVDWVSLDLTKVLTLAITGREGFGKTNAVGLVLDYLQQNIFEYSSKVYIVDDYDRQLSSYSSYGMVEKYTIDSTELEYILTEMEEELKSRLDILHAGGSLEAEPLLLCILQNEDLLIADGIKKAMADTIRRMVKLYSRLKVCFIFANVNNETYGYSAPEGIKLVKESKYTLVCEDLANLKLMDVGNANLRRFKKPIELGDAYLVTEKEVAKVKVIHTESAE